MELELEHGGWLGWIHYLHSSARGGLDVLYLLISALSQRSHPPVVTVVGAGTRCLDTRVRVDISIQTVVHSRT
jgi:hypothetical protein